MEIYTEAEMWEQLLRIERRLRVKAFFYCKNTEFEPDDLFMETLAVCQKYRDRFEAGSNLYGWAASRMRFVFLDWLRKPRPEPPPPPPPPPSDPVRKCLEKISPTEKRDIYIENKVLGFTAVEISEKRNKNKNTILTWLADTNKQMIKCLELEGITQ